MYLALYRKWRPQTFSDVRGQDHITAVLKSQAAGGRISHAYLFCGSRGTGKTTTAKILAKAANCLDLQDGDPCNRCESCRAIDAGSTPDVLEIDAASNNSVENIRDLREEVVYPPSMLKKRVYIIDEVHMLSTSAFNALLKTLEEPPAHVIFILATTELHAIPATILSRCLRFEFTRISDEVIRERLVMVAKEEAIELTDEAAALLARLADGALRDALSLLESCAAAAGSGPLDAAAVRRQPSPQPEVKAALFSRSAELLEALQGHKNLYSFLSLSRIVEQGDALKVYTDYLGKNIMSTDGAKKLIADAAAAVTGRRFTVEITEKAPEQEHPSLIYELQEAAEQESQST